MLEYLDKASTALGVEVIAQCISGGAAASNIKVLKKLPPNQFDALLTNSEVVVAHAGIGSILKATDAEKPIILVPRLHSLGEHRNDHQTATVNHLSKIKGIYVATTSEALIDLIRVRGSLEALGNSDSESRGALISYTEDFLRRP